MPLLRHLFVEARKSLIAAAGTAATVGVLAGTTGVLGREVAVAIAVATPLLAYITPNGTLAVLPPPTPLRGVPTTPPPPSAG
jgi:hypothetical protein